MVQQLLSCNYIEKVPGAWCILHWQQRNFVFLEIWKFNYFKVLFFFFTLSWHNTASSMCCTLWWWIRSWRCSVAALVHRTSGGRCCIRCSLVVNLVCANCLQAVQAASSAQPPSKRNKALTTNNWCGAVWFRFYLHLVIYSTCYVRHLLILKQLQQGF